MSRRGRWLVAAAALVLVPACSSDSDGDALSDREAPDGGSSTTTSSRETLDVEPGHVVVEAGGRRFSYIVFQCLIGDETGSPNRRLALSASTTEPFADAEEVLNVDILVSRTTGSEEHTIAITRRDGRALGAADAATPSRGGPAPDDWIDVDAAARKVTGSGFELRATDGSDDGLGDGRLTADCN